jgi:uncharacterized protein YprB with RNaseH-like and TPR domain
MGALEFFRKFLGNRRISIDRDVIADKEYNQPVLRHEISASAGSHLAEQETDVESPKQFRKVTGEPDNKADNPKTSPKSARSSTPDNILPDNSITVGEFIHNERSKIKYSSGILKNTFIHLKGIGHQKETALWMDGILTHDDALNKGVLATKKNFLQNSKQDIKDKNWYPFYEGMNSKDHWRLFGDLVNETAYIDIETTGLGSATDIITTAVVHSSQSTHVFVNGMNLDKLPSHLNQFNLIVTYNGKSFDIPFIERFFKTNISSPHIDLRYILAGMGYKGGLKSCEQQLRLPIREGMEEIDGYTAVLLWNYYFKTKDPKALETLLAYNYEDSVRLEWLMIEAYNQKLSELPFDSDKLHKPALPSNPYKSDSALLRRI